ncbi:MAG: ABC transporter permease [Candidatus Omnitrophica bacterium]|nr:ABC transporter permease [Candidatus Omnitrophota bacterium]
MPEQKIILDSSIPGTICIKLSGAWLIAAGIPKVDEIIVQVHQAKGIQQLTFDTRQMSEWDSGLIAFLFHLIRECEHKHIQASLQDLPIGVQKLLSLALKVHEKPIVDKVDDESFFTRVADKVLILWDGMLSLLNFLGEIAVAFGRFFTGKAYFRWDEFVFLLQRCGADALFLVSLISVLVGIILAFIGATQLKLFGAQIYIANVVGIGMVRAMGAMMAAILMAGRTGASFAAELGLMQTNEEIDALKTLGVSPVEFLVIPRVLALVIMMPLLTLYANLMGILGGFIIGISLLGLNPVEYWQHTQSSVTLSNLWVGLIHSFVFGVIIAVAGCFRGMQCRRSAAAVGEATTKAVVSAIISIVIATAVITFVCQVLGV